MWARAKCPAADALYSHCIVPNGCGRPLCTVARGIQQAVSASAGGACTADALAAHLAAHMTMLADLQRPRPRSWTQQDGPRSAAGRHPSGSTWLAASCWQLLQP